MCNNVLNALVLRKQTSLEKTSETVSANRWIAQIVTQCTRSVPKSATYNAGKSPPQKKTLRRKL